jgi:hypothetical protein
MRRPTVYPPSIVTYLEPVTISGLYEMQILSAIHFAQNDIPDFQGRRIHWRDCAKLTRVNLPTHRVAAWPKLYRFAPL